MAMWQSMASARLSGLSNQNRHRLPARNIAADRGQGGDYGICLKGNQGRLREDVKLLLDDAIQRKSRELDICQTLDKEHGRIERRKTWATSDVDWLRKRHPWPGLASIAAVESRVKRKGETCVERRYFIGSFDLQCAHRSGVLARNHWSVENNLH
jgi:hypothetical protein